MMLASRAHRFPVLAAAASAAAIAVLGAFTVDLGTWYQSLLKPEWQPPDAVFGPAWTVIYGLAACAALLAWVRTRDASARRMLLGLFVLNAALNGLWSVLFFRLQRPDLAYFEVFLLWMSLVALIAWLWTHSRVSSALLLPYLVWVTYAVHMNLTIVMLNSPLVAAS